eukprot:10363367-Lingulodinium_polyedra.AAC.1
MGIPPPAIYAYILREAPAARHGFRQADMWQGDRTERAERNPRLSSGVSAGATPRIAIAVA